MKKSAITLALAGALFGSFAVHASEFDGSWAGAKVGVNDSDAVILPTTLNRRDSTALGLEGGHNWNVGSVLLGVNGYYDLNAKKTHAPGGVNYGSDTYGLDAKLGLPKGKWLPYAKVGYGRTTGSGGATTIRSSDEHYGVGVEYKFAPSWSLAAEYSKSHAANAAGWLANNNYTVGVNYYFNKPAAVVPMVVAAAAPVMAKPDPVPMAAPVPTPAPTPKEVWKTLLENKPVNIEGAYFAFDSAKLRGGSLQKLDEVVDFAKQYPDAELEAAGHTDSIGDEAYNQTLSERRAESVKGYLVSHGVDGSRVMVKGYGETQPVADNKTSEGRAQNRRVEIRSVVKEEKRVRVVQ
ncbi:MAG: OmpA family protein [Pseudomonadota bacterium]